MATGNRKLSKSPKYLDSNGELNLIAGTNVSISSTDSSITISATDTNTTYTNVSEFINDANYLDSTTVQGVIDASYIQANQTTYTNVSEFVNDANYLDSTTVQGVIDGSYIQANQTTYNTSNFLDSTTVALVVDAAYVQARQTTYNTSDFVDSAYVTTQINNLIGGAPGTLDTLEEIANALNNDSNAYGSLVALINGMADSDWVQSLPVSTFTNDANYLDSNTVTNVVDASYIQARQTTYNTSNFTDSAFVTGLPISTFTNDANYLDSTTAISVIRSTEANAFGNIHVPGQTTVSADSANDVLNIVGNNGIRIVTDAGGNEIDISFVNSANYLDSTTVQDVINSSYIQSNQTTYNTSDFLDSTTVANVVDAAYVQARQTTYSTVDFLDSTYAIALIDSAYIEARRPAETIFGVVNNGTSAYTFSGDGFPSTVDNPTLYLARGKTYKFSVNASSHPFQIRVSDGGSAYSNGVTNNGAQVGDVIFTVPMNAPNSLVYQCTVHSGMVGNIVIFNENSFLDSSTVTGVINAAYIQANQTTYTNVSEFTNDANYLDSTTVQSVIDASYIQSNQTTYSTADFLDSYYAIALFDSAYIQLRQSSVGSGGLDSALVIDLIDSAYIQARQIVGGAGGGVDSAATITLITDTIDSAYVQARQTVGGGATTVGTLGVTTYTYEADSGDTIFTGADVNGATLAFASSGLIQVFRNGVLLSTDDYTASSNTVTLTFGADSADVISISAFGGYQSISGRLGIDITDSSAVFGQTVFTRTYTPGKIMVFRNGVLLKDSDDYTATNGTSITLASAADSNDYISISEFIGDNGIDSATAIGLIDSAHVQLRQDYAYSSLTGAPTNISTFTNDANYLDSTTVQGVIDASYIQSNQTTYSTADFLDSVYTLALLANNDITIGAVVETYSAIGASDIDLSTANYFSKTISGTTTFTVSNVASSGNVSSFILELTNGGSATVNWFSGVTWASATAPTLTASGLDILGFFTRDGGTTWRGLVLAQAVA